MIDRRVDDTSARRSVDARDPHRRGKSALIDEPTPKNRRSLKGVKGKRGSYFNIFLYILMILNTIFVLANLWNLYLNFKVVTL